MNEESVPKNRIELLDSFRTIAILLVMLFHYFSRWRLPINKFNLYDYSINVDFFQYGYLGVELFFMISGYVIVYTLFKTNNFVSFWRKRLIRLLPTMFICSLVTFLVFLIFDSKCIFPNSHLISNWFVSLTLVSPSIPNILFGTELNYLDGSYWSLWVEIQFYLLVSIVYFSNKDKFFYRFLILSFLGYCSYVVLNSNFGTALFSKIFSELFIKNVKIFYSVFNIFEYNLWFLLGVIIYKLHNDKFNKKFLFLLGLIFSVQLNFAHNLNIILYSIAFLGLFLFLVYKPKWINFLNNKIISNIGLASYSLYLLHQNIGVLLINKFSSNFGYYSFLFPLFVVLGLILFSYYCFYYVEKPIIKKLSDFKK